MSLINSPSRAGSRGIYVGQRQQLPSIDDSGENDSRHDEENQAISENELDDEALLLAYGGECKLKCRHDEDEKVEAHRIDERGCE